MANQLDYERRQQEEMIGLDDWGKAQMAMRKAICMKNHPEGDLQKTFAKKLVARYLKNAKKAKAKKARAAAKKARAAAEKAAKKAAADSDTESETEEDFEEGPHGEIVAQVEKLGHPWYAQHVRGNTWKVCKFTSLNNLTETYDL